MKHYLRYLFLLQIAILAHIDSHATDWVMPIPSFSPLSVDDTVYVYNVGANRFYNRGEWWDSQAILSNTGMRFIVRNAQKQRLLMAYEPEVGEIPDGIYTLYSDDTGNNNHLTGRFDDGYIYVDSYFTNGKPSRTYWSIVPVNGLMNVYQIFTPPYLNEDSPYSEANFLYEEGKALGYNPDLTATTWCLRWNIAVNEYPNACHWAFVSTGDYAVHLAKMELKSIAEGAEYMNIDLTYAKTVFDDPFATVEEINSAINAIKYGSKAIITDISLFDNVIYMDKTDVVVGNKQVTLSVKMKNNVAAEGFSFDLHLPNGMCVATDEDGFPQVSLSEERTNSRKTNTFESVFLPDGGLRVFGASTNGSIISGNDGEIVVITINIADNLGVGEYPVSITNIVISDENANAHEVEQVTSALSLFGATDISLIDNVIYIDSVNVVKESQATLSVKMKNSVAVEGFSFDLYLPDGMSIATDEDGFPKVFLSAERTNSRKTNTFESVILPDGGLRVFGASTNGGIISGNDGEIVVVDVNVANVKEGEYPVILKNIVISDEDAKAHEANDVITILRVLDYVIGDVNMDGKVNVADYTSVAHHIMGNTPEVFNKNAADANHDGKINVADLTATAHIIMYGSIEKPHAVKRKLIPLIPE